MDISETYILMCEKAEEIQEGHQWGDGDYTQSGIYIEHYWDEFGWNVNNKNGRGDKYIWLPRQDQLQEMIFKKTGKYDEHELVRDFAEFVYENSENWSMEQLWLAFVMKKRYNKVWDGSEWITG